MNNLYRFSMEKKKTSILQSRFLLRCAVLMVLIIAWMTPARAQHPFTLTTAADITNSTQHYYLIQSIDRPSFYAIPHSNAEDSKVSTTSIPNVNMRWCFVDAGSDSDHQYYYIVNSTGKCLYRYIDNNSDPNDGIRIKKTYAELSSLSDDELNKYKFYLTQTGSDYFIQPKGASGLYLNKRGGNIQYASNYYIKVSTYNDLPSVWNFVAVGEVTWLQPFTTSTNADKHYYKFQNVTNASFCLSTSEEWATISSTWSNENVWYYLDAGTDSIYSNCHYYYIVNALTEKYLYYTGGTDNDVAKIMDYNSTEADKYRFLIVKAAYKPDNTNYATGYTIVPKLRQAYFYDKDSFAPMAMNDNSHLLLKSDRGSNNYNSHWEIEETDYVLVEAPTITNNFDGTISLSTTTTGATIYYTTNGDTPDNTSAAYFSAFSLGNAIVIKAIAYLGSESSSVTTYNVPKFATPTITFDNSISEVTITCNGATGIYYTIDGSTPTTYSNQYSAPFTVSSPTSVKAIATHAGYLNSNEATMYITPSNDYSQNYLTFNVITDGTICWRAFGSNSAKTIEYSINGGSWIPITSTSAGVTIPVVTNDVVRFRGTETQYALSNINYSGFEGGTATFNIEGNIMSLIHGDNFSNNTALTGTYNFCSIFKKSKVISAENLILPATTMTEGCYRAMFSKSPTLEVAPALPATTLGAYCYYYMFEQCAITSAPKLPAPILVSNCYGNMFNGCTSLNYILCLAVDKSASGCLTNWVNSVSSTGIFVKDENATWSTGASGIPSGWVVNDHIAAPEDPVITCDGEFITITCQTYGASIYYRLGQTGSYSLYSAPIAIYENTVVEAYAVKNELESNIVSENCIAIKSYKFAGMKITPGPLYYGSNGYEIKDGWNYDSYNLIYGKTIGSTYFNFIELGQLFESSVFSTSDGDIEKVLDPLNGWRVPTNAELASILGTTRSGSTVNGASNKHYAMIQLTGVTHANSSTPSGLLIFPDGETITGAALSDMDNTTSNTSITELQLNDYLSQGCIFLPGSGYYNGSLQTWDNGHYYWSSTENDSSTGYDLHFEPSNTISSDDNKNKETYYFPVYLVKDAADEATRLLRTWTYNNNEVELPYSVNAIDGHSPSYARGTFTFTTDVKIKESQPTYLWFQHADQSATVYVDNTLVEKHWGGYNAFFVDISNYVHSGTNNIKVALKNNEGNNLAPCAGDFNFNATLGEVKLISSPVVPNPDYGYDGFHITSTVTSASAIITVKTSVPTDATLTCSIKGTNCNYSSTQTGSGEITFTTTITNPHLWNGTLDPYLYDVTLAIAKDGVVYHKFKRGYGLRFYEYVIDTDAPENSRFLLNGSPYLLRGVCMHHDLEGKANALTAEDIDNDFEILKELGCNFVRLAHYPHPKEVYDRCDRLGIIVQTEVPCVNNFKNSLPQDYYDHLYIQYEDMVRQHYNHPCIMFWGLFNEATTDDTSIAKTRLEAYRTFIKSIDPERWVGYVVSHGSDNPGGLMGDPDMDWFGCNIYVGWYIDKTSNNPTNRLNTRLSKTLARLGKPLAFSEYGCGGTQNCHSDDFMTTTTKGTSTSSVECDRHDIEYLMWLHEGHIAAIKNFPQLLFTAQWQLFDIAVSSRHEGYKICKDGETLFDNNELKSLNNKGLVERDHKTKKDPFYLYKAWWNQTDKFVHICGKDYKKLTDRAIKCYTNDGSILTLFVNDVEIETATVENNIATFTARDFNPGDVIRVTGDTSNDTFTFTNYNVFTTEGNWNVTANWSAGAVPTAGCDVDIVANATIPSGYTADAGNISLYGSTLTIADGGQLISNSAVNATVEKNITAYTVSQNQGELLTDGWYFIASPIRDDYTPTGSMVENTYDLYRLNPTTARWENYKNTTGNPDFTTLNNGTGYLYANSAQTTLSFTGTLKPYEPSESVSVSTGWNLIGNPFTYNVYANRSYYKMNEAKTDVEAVSAFSTSPIAPCTGIVVEAETNGNVIFSKEVPTQSQGSNGSLQIALNQPVTEPVERAGVSTSSTTFVDKAIVSFNKGDQLGKFYFGTQNANIYIPQGAEEYAIVNVSRDGVHTISTMDVNFKAKENGTYTITVNPEGVEMSYLHLIDNMTEEDVDLLKTPEYTFNAKTADYASRFKLVFVCGDANDDNETFAFINNGYIIITADVEGATLQVIDVMGRVIVSREGDVSGNVSTSGMTPGTYVLRLINGENVMTQKIVIR